MVPTEQLIAFSVAAIILIVIPGPSVLFAIARALALGKVGGLLTVVGNSLGHIPIIVAVGLGLGVVVAESPVLFTILKIVGAGYIAYLGFQAIRHRNDAASRAQVALGKSNWRILGEGFVVGLTNPKTVAFFVAILPQFVVPAAGNVPLQTIQLGLIFMVLGTLSDSIWALSAGWARDWFAQNPKRMAAITGTGGVLLIGLGVALLFTGSG